MIKATKEDIFEVRKPRPCYPVIDPIKNRFSPRYFSSQPIPEKDLNSIFEAARWTPSGFNNQPWYFYWSKQGEPSFNNIISCLAKYNYWAKTASVLIIACYIPIIDGKNDHYARHDLGAAVMSLVLQAQHLGYYCRQIGEFNKNKLIKLFNFDKTHHPFVIIALGKLGDYQHIDEALLKRELDPKLRKKDFVKKI